MFSAHCWVISLIFHLRGDTTSDGFPQEVQTARNGEPEGTSGVCKSLGGSWKEDGGEYPPASAFRRILESIPFYTVPEGPLKTPGGSGWPQKVLAGPWSTRGGAGSSLECCERDPEQPTPGPRHRLNSGRQIHPGAAWAMADISLVRSSPVSYLSGDFVFVCI